MIVALVSSYREGALLGTCVASALPHVDHVLVAEGPADGHIDESDHPLTGIGLGSSLSVKTGVWSSDAEKRTEMLTAAVSRWIAAAEGSDDLREPLWVLWLDGDEVLLWGEYLRDWTGRAEQETGAGGFPLRLVELDGSVANCYGKLVRGDLIKRYLHSVLEVELLNGMIVALPNVPLCAAGGVPLRPDDLTSSDVADTDVQRWLATCRPPLQGEPHLLHRSALRDPARGVRRLHEAEAEAYR